MGQLIVFWHVRMICSDELVDLLVKNLFTILSGGTDILLRIGFIRACLVVNSGCVFLLRGLSHKC